MLENRKEILQDKDNRIIDLRVKVPLVMTIKILEVVEFKIEINKIKS